MGADRSASAVAEETPLMRQWREAKARSRDALLFFRVGDFYELFREDAEEGARLLGLTLTSRNNGAAAGVPMAGVPAKALPEYLGRLVKMGRRAAICDQVEDAAEAQGIVRREIVETVTPGTVLHDGLLDSRKNNFLVVLTPERAGAVGLAAADLSTGEVVVEAVPVERVRAELGRLGASEVLLPSSLRETEDGLGESLQAASDRMAVTYRDDWLFDREIAADEIARRFGVRSLDGLGFQAEDHLQVAATGALVQYLREIHPGGAEQLQHPRIRRPGHEMFLDDMTRRNLELIEPLRAGEEGGTLLDVLDECVTAMGARLMRQWILRPLVSPERIRHRQGGVVELVEDREMRRGLRSRLRDVQDVERLVGRIATGRGSPRDVVALGRSLDLIPELGELLAPARSGALRDVAWDDDDLGDVASLIDEAIAAEVPQSIQDGGVIREGYSAELDELRRVRDGARDFIASLQTRERERTGIGSLKVGFNRVFGYYLEVTRANLESVPEDYVRKQTLANAERYFTAELKEWEEKVSGAEDRILELETRLFQDVRSRIAAEVPRVQDAARKLAALDGYSALAHVAERRRYVRPELHEGRDLEILAGRHPVVETMMPAEAFIPNDIALGEDSRIVILTGPNMAGKSTVLRQVGLIQLMAQMGSFVPADEARLPVCDRIFTRVGASDNLARGQSTFMVEMNESAAILNGATDASLILLDEIGRGTSTYDGVSIAWAITEHIHEHLGAKTIFATHYHELTQLGDLLAGVTNMNVAVRETGEDIVFLRRLEPGGADRSYGIQVARIAGLPREVVARALEILTELEGTHSGGGEGLGSRGSLAPPSVRDRPQLSLFDAEDPLVARLRNMDIDSMTPLDALNALHAIRAAIVARAADGAEGAT